MVFQKLFKTLKRGYHNKDHKLCTENDEERFPEQKNAELIKSHPDLYQRINALL